MKYGKIVRNLLAGVGLTTIALGMGIIIGSLDTEEIFPKKDTDDKEPEKEEPKTEEPKNSNIIDLSAQPKIKYFGEGYTVNASDVKETIREPKMFTIPKQYAFGDLEDPRPVMRANATSNIMDLNTRISALESEANEINPTLKFKDWYAKEISKMDSYRKDYEMKDHEFTNKEDDPFRYPSPAEIIPVMCALSNITNAWKRTNLAALYRFYAFECHDHHKASYIASYIYFFENKWRRRKAKISSAIPYSENYWSYYSSYNPSTKPLESADMTKFDADLNIKVRKFYTAKMNLLSPCTETTVRQQYIKDKTGGLNFHTWIAICSEDIQDSIREFDNSYSLHNNALREIPDHNTIAMTMKLLASINSPEKRIKLTAMYIHWAFIIPIHLYANHVEARIAYEAAHQSDGNYNLDYGFPVDLHNTISTDLPNKK